MRSTRVRFYMRIVHEMAHIKVRNGVQHLATG